MQPYNLRLLIHVAKANWGVCEESQFVGGTGKSMEEMMDERMEIFDICVHAEKHLNSKILLWLCSIFLFLKKYLQRFQLF